MEQKYQAVLAVIRDGVSIVEVANRFGVSHQSVHSWLLRYEMEGMAGLVERSHRPQKCEHQMSSQTQVRILELCRANLMYGSLNTTPSGPTRASPGNRSAQERPAKSTQGGDSKEECVAWMFG